jgi:putative DNA primase/helicase
MSQLIDDTLPEISWQASQAIESWRRILDHMRGPKLDTFKRAAVELLRLAEKEGSLSVIVDELYHMAVSADIDPDTAQEVFAAARSAPPDDFTGPTLLNEPSQVTAMNYVDLLKTEFPPRETVLAPWLLSKGTAMIHGWRGLGKTLLTHGSAWAIATGGGFLKWKAAAPRRVLVIDGEMPMAALQERFRAIEAGSHLKPAPDYLRIAAADMFRDGLPDLADPKAQQFYADVVANADVIFADNLSTLCPHLKENDAEDYAPFQAWVLQQRREGRSAILVHHSGKSGSQRGSSKKEDILDSALSVRRPPDYSAEQGARFEVHFEKSRGFYGPDAEPFEAQLIGNQWRVGPIKSGDDDETLRTLKRQGLSVRDISERTGIPRSTVHRKLNSEGGEENSGRPMGHA